jgi:ABC-type multidrug transport system ATPase subunit
VKCDSDCLVLFSEVSKTFNKLEVLHPVSFTLSRGRSLAILGPNGAGKTTMMRILLGVLKPTSGDVQVFGSPITSSSFESKKRIGVVIEEQTFFLDMSAWDYLHLFGELYGIENISDRASFLMSYMELYDSRFKKLKEYSTGMKKKLNIIQAVLHQPDILILDEPFSGLDPIGINQTVHLLREMKANGSTLVISSHILSEIDDLVEDMIIMNSGTVKAAGSKMNLWRGFHGTYFLNLSLLEENRKGIENLTNLPEIKTHTEQKTLQHIFSVSDDGESRRKISRSIIDNGLLVSHISYTEPSVKMIYEQVMGSGDNSGCLGESV